MDWFNVIYWAGFFLTLGAGVIENAHAEAVDRIPLPLVILLAVFWPFIWLANIIGVYLRSRS